jgi:hypothetical protein
MQPTISAGQRISRRSTIWLRASGRGSSWAGSQSSLGSFPISTMHAISKPELTAHLRRVAPQKCRRKEECSSASLVRHAQCACQTSNHVRKVMLPGLPTGVYCPVNVSNPVSA